MKNSTIEQQILELNQKGFSDIAISKKLNISESKAGNIRRKLGLPIQNRTHITDEQVIQGVKDGLTVTQIYKKYNTSEAQVRRRLIKLGLIAKNDTKDFDEKIKSLLDQGLNIREISEKLNVTRRDRIWDSIKRLGLFDSFLAKNKKMTTIHNNISEEDLKKYSDQGYTDEKLAEHFNVSLSSIKKLRKKYKIPINVKYRILDIDEFTEEEFQVLYGTLLGDGHLTNRYRNISGSIAHCMKQKEFLEFKHTYLKRFTNPIEEHHKYDIRYKNPNYTQCYMYIKGSKALNALYPKLYNNKIKYINKELLFKLTGLGIATWYMDDGSNGKYGYILCTNSFSSEDVLLIQKFFKEKFDIETTIRKDNVIYIKAKSKQKFKDLVSPYIIPSMQYKL